MKFILYTLVFIFLLVSCAKEEIDPSQANLPVTEGLILNKNEGQTSDLVANSVLMNKYITQVDSALVVYDKNVPNASSLLPGRVILANPNERTPNGFMRYIEERKEENGLIILKTREATFGEAFDRLSIDARFKTVGNSVLRGPFEIESKAVADLELPIGGGYNFTIQPEFGMSGDFIFIFDADYEAGIFNEMKMGVEDLVLKLGTTYSYNGLLTGEAKKEYKLPLPFVITIPIGQWIITINTRVVFAASAEVKAKGAIKMNHTLENQPITLLTEINPALYESPTYANVIYNNPNDSLSDLQFTTTLLEASGEIESEWALPVSIHMAPYGAFDASKVFLDFNLLKINMINATEVVNDKFQIRSTLNYAPSIGMGVELELLERFLKKNDLLQIPVKLEYTVYEEEFQLDEEIYCFPCEITFRNARMEVACVNENEVELSFGIQSQDATSDGYELSLNGDFIGNYEYNKLYSTKIRSDQYDLLSTLRIQDVESPSCVLEWKLVDPCELSENCDSEKFVDQRDGQEYCYTTMKNGSKWMASNLKYSGAGVCHENMNERCDVLGRYYTFEEAQEACPSGWRLPTEADWVSMLEKDDIHYGGAGLNITPAGQLQTWIQGDSVNSQFTGSVFDDDLPLNLFWTTQAVEGQQGQPDFLTVGGLAMRIVGSTYVKTVTPLTTGLPCRCIKN